jgi:hypothetical protein
MAQNSTRPVASSRSLTPSTQAAQIPAHPPLVKNPAVICKTGCTDLRRGMQTLSKMVEHMGFEPHDGNMYAFSNEKDTVKIIQQKEDGMAMLTQKIWHPFYWPEYQLPYMVIFAYIAGAQFLATLGCPKSL